MIPKDQEPNKKAYWSDFFVLFYIFLNENIVLLLSLPSLFINRDPVMVAYKL